MPPIQTIQPSEQRLRWTATVTLGLLLAAHTLMETGRDALFLANIPAERLPWVYIAVALLSVWVARIGGRAGSARALRRRLVCLQLVASGSVLGFWWMMGVQGPWLYYGLYVWAGVVSGVLVVSFWLLLGDLFTITQGKRFFASIAIGGAVGALAGAALATGMATLFRPEDLLLAAAVLYGLSAIAPLTVRADADTSRDSVSEDDDAGLWDGVRRIVAHPYAVRVAGLVVLASASLTLADYLFKSVLAEEVDPSRLSIWLSRIYLGLNLLSILMLAVGVTPIVRRLGVDRSLALLPVLMVVATLGVFAGFALSAIVLLKAADGTLRYSLHKTASELLFLPMDSRLRRSVKGVIDLVGGTGAKALASVGILVLVATPDPRLAISVALMALAVVWAVSALRLRGAYLDVFRATLSRGSIETSIEHPELDVASVESLIRALSDRNERAVLAAMDLLVERDRCNLIPSLILYHPSPEVVERAVDIFASAGRDDVLDFQDRLLEHEYASVRSAIVRAVGVLAPDRELLERLSQGDCPCVRVSAVAGLLNHDWVGAALAEREFRAAIAHVEPDTRVAVANAAKLQYAEVYREVLRVLGRDPSAEVAREAVRAMAASDDVWFMPVLIELLDDRRVRDLVRPALLERGYESLELLAKALCDPSTPVGVARHVPTTIARFGTAEAMAVLLDGLSRVRSGMVRYRILRGLQRMATSPLAPRVVREPVVEELRETVERALHLVHLEVELARGQRTRRSRRTPGGEILVDVVRDKETLATSRIFLLLSLLHPEEDFRTIEAGVRSSSPTERASAVELLENLVLPELRRATIGLASDETPARRLRFADPQRSELRIEYEEAVQLLAQDTSQAVRAFALYHAGELELEVEPELAPDEAAAARAGMSLRDRAIRRIERLPEALGMRPGERGAAVA